MNIKQHKQALLEKLYRQYKNCQKCPLSKLGRTNIIFGEGNSDADLMIIGEAPGKKEDELVKPFVGKSGQLLIKTLENLHLKREDIFITNIVKCRPPYNRGPLSNESEICTKLFLFNQIKIVAPKVICTLGATATQIFTCKTIKITEIRGLALKKDGLLIIPTYHPAYILRNNKNLEKFSNDILLAKNILNDFSSAGG